MPKNTSDPKCAVCPYDWSERYCRHDRGKAPANCPSTRSRDLVDQSVEAIRSPEIREFARQASIQEAECYSNRGQGYESVRPAKPRVVEVIEFAKRWISARLPWCFV